MNLSPVPAYHPPIFSPVHSPELGWCRHHLLIRGTPDQIQQVLRLTDGENLRFERVLPPPACLHLGSAEYAAWTAQHWGAGNACAGSVVHQVIRHAHTEQLSLRFSTANTPALKVLQALAETTGVRAQLTYLTEYGRAGQAGTLSGIWFEGDATPGDEQERADILEDLQE